MSNPVNFPPSVPLDRPNQYQKTLFPFDAFSSDDPNVTAVPTLTLKSPWQQSGTFKGTGTALLTSITGTAVSLASSNPVLLLGQIGYETDTLSFKIGDGVTAYNSLSYAYRGLPVAGEPSLGTPHDKTGTQAAWLVNGVTPGAGTWYTVTFTVPAGTKAVRATVGIVIVLTADSVRWRPYNNGDSYANSFHRILIQSNRAGDTPAIQVMIPVDASGRVDLAVGTAGQGINVGYPQIYDL